MLNNMKNMLLYFGAHSTDIIVSVVIMVSAIIVAIGFLKPILFDRIKNKELRKVALAVSNVAASFISAFGYFVKEGWDFKYYVLASLALTVACIITYYVYETIPGMRKLIGGLGAAAIGKVFNVALLAATTNDDNVVKAEFQNATVELKDTTRQELKKSVTKVKEGNDLAKL